MGKEVLQITIKEPRQIKTKFGRWWHHNIYWKIWVIGFGKIKAAFYMGMSNFFLSLLPKHKREEILNEFNDIEVHIVNESEGEQMSQAIKDALETQYGVDYDEDEFKKRLEEDMENLLKQ